MQRQLFQNLKQFNYLVKQGFKNNIKQEPIPESYVQTKPSANQEGQDLKSDIKIEIKNYHTDGAPERGLRGQKPVPQSPTLGPITVENPKIGSKKYYWCSCGQSLKQPFCDGSHKGTEFLPVKFTVEEVVKKIELCGCKFTQSAPFCDGQTCKKLSNPSE